MALFSIYPFLLSFAIGLREAAPSLIEEAIVAQVKQTPQTLHTQSIYYSPLQNHEETYNIT